VSAAATLPGRPSAARPWRFPSVLIDRLRLADGRELVVRPVLAFDAAAEQDFVRALSAGSRQRRFHVGLRELPPPVLRAMTDVDHDAHVAIVAEAIGEDDDATIVADARYVRGPTADLGRDEAEFAIAVADAWQGAGLGRALMKHLARHAARHGITRLVGDVLPGNAAMFAITGALGGRLVASPNGPGVIRAAFELSAGGATSARRAPA
jgi:GNAT superfamily N-acetyltransferase